jgi:serine/threonine-protein kinase HipA
VRACRATLEPLSSLAVEHGYDLGEADGATRFLAVVRYDRAPGLRVHCEDFAQVLGVMPEDKYQGASYLNVAGALMSLSSLGEPAVHELLRRVAVNELLGNPDMHLKNIGLRYPDGVTPELAPAYDIVAYAAYGKITGHGLRLLPEPEEAGGAKPRLTPPVLREFCARLGLAEKPASGTLRACVRAALDTWPGMIEASLLTVRQKERLLAHFRAHPWTGQVQRRRATADKPAG